MSSSEVLSSPLGGSTRDWGTGSDAGRKTPKTSGSDGSWYHTDVPLVQYYDLTSLRRSNLRSNDELIPRPQETDLTKIQIRLPFPAEHPYTSHIQRYDVFPKFDSPSDPKRGVDARQRKVISAETPARPPDVLLVHQRNGHAVIRGRTSTCHQMDPAATSTGQVVPHRHEVLHRSSERLGLQWVGDHGFYHPGVKPDPTQQFYPTPPKLITPNLQKRDGSMMVSDRTANALRNVERLHWETTYKNQHTGLGQTNPLLLDNAEEKRLKFHLTGVEDDHLYPGWMPTFDPPRPDRGRIWRDMMGIKDGPDLSQIPEWVDLEKVEAVNACEREAAAPPPDAPPVDGYIHHGGPAKDYFLRPYDGSIVQQPEPAPPCSHSTEYQSGDQPRDGIRHYGDQMDQRQLESEKRSPKDGPTVTNYQYERLEAQSRRLRNLASKSIPIGIPLNENCFWMTTGRDGRSMTAPHYFDLNYKSDLDIWQNGQLRPQTTLSATQRQFSKTEVQKRFLEQFPERAPDLRDYMHSSRGKRHAFYGLNSQSIHG